MKQTNADRYADRFRRVFEYIDENLDGKLSLEQLSQIAHFSKYHFHRQFTEFTGVSVFKYVQLMRLRRSSYRLAFSHVDRIIDIALDNGFENPESFARAFKKAFGQTPSEFRLNPAWAHWNEQYRFSNRRMEQDMDVRIVTFEQTSVAALEHRGPIDRLNNTAGLFIAWRKETGLSPVQSSRTFGIAYDNPETTEPDQFRFDICGSVDAAVPDNPQGVINKLIPGGRCAVVRHLGPHQRLGERIHPLYRDWLPQSGEDIRDFPLFFHYLNLLPDTPEHDLTTDIYLPLK
jgi:AraC family transcriptional regulator